VKRYEILLLVIIAAASAGCTPTFSKIALENMSSGTLTILRYVYTLIALLIIVNATRKPINWKGVYRAMPVSIFASLNVIFFAIGIKHMQAASVSLLYTLSPMIVSVLSLLILKEKTNLGKVIGIVIGLSGVIIVIASPALSKGQHINFSTFGTIIILASVVSVSLFTVISKKVHNVASPSDIMMATTITTISGQTLLSLVTRAPLSVAHITTRTFLASLVVGLIGTTVYYWLIQYAIKAGTPLLASLNLYIMPIFGALIAFIVLNDRLSPIAMLGGTIALIGVAQVNGLFSALISHKRQKPPVLMVSE
jgi:drug/metabolite transporter (DMT)-like permease